MKPVRLAAMLLITLLVIYPLSIGPAAVVEIRSNRPLLLSAFYAPLWWVAQKTDTEDIMIWYYNRWLAYFGWGHSLDFILGH